MLDREHPDWFTQQNKPISFQCGLLFFFSGTEISVQFWWNIVALCCVHVLREGEGCCTTSPWNEFTSKGVVKFNDLLYSTHLYSYQFSQLLEKKCKFTSVSVLVCLYVSMIPAVAEVICCYLPSWKVVLDGSGLPSNWSSAVPQITW